MLDTLKFHSSSLNIDIKTKIFLPNDYDKTSEYFESVYIVSKSDPFVKDFKLENTLEEKNLIAISIFPNNDIEKNKLLFESFESKYNYSFLYQEAIIKEILPYVEKRYRIKKAQANRSLVGYAETSLLAFTMALDYNLFSNVFCVKLDLTKIKNHILVYLKAKFDPNIKYYISMDDRKLLSEIAQIERLFGQPELIELDQCQPSSLIEYL